MVFTTFGVEGCGRRFEELGFLKVVGEEFFEILQLLLLEADVEDTQSVSGSLLLHLMEFFGVLLKFCVHLRMCHSWLGRFVGLDKIPGGFGFDLSFCKVKTEQVLPAISVDFSSSEVANFLSALDLIIEELPLLLICELLSGHGQVLHLHLINPS